MTKDKPQPTNFKPSDYLRARRPERYSDSVKISVPQLTTDLLEYHLNTLTNRKQENEFEYLARLILEKEICPNLLPQTGPTGGGDSKVDIQTYPVAEKIAIRWYQGDASASERWAFAISAQKEWLKKFKKDIASIASTGRDYKIIYFVTNQFVPDKKRAKAEDEAFQTTKIKTFILDRSWLVEKVIKNDHVEVAAVTLSIPGLLSTTTKKLGPNDAKRRVELEEVDKKISNPQLFLGIEFQLAEECLRGAILASELENPRSDVDGRFEAAIRIANSGGDKSQISRVIYYHAWVSCFVYDDLLALSRLYSQLEVLALASERAIEVERLFNLWNVLLGAEGLGQISKADADLIPRLEKLSKHLDTLSKQKNRPNNSHTALTMRCLLDFGLLIHKKAKDEDYETLFTKLNGIFQRSKGLGDYPFHSFSQIILEIGEQFASNDSYETLFETVVGETQSRESEGAAGIRLLNRGIQLLKNEKQYEAIRLFGRAQPLLIKEEHQFDLLRSLVACNSAYIQAGLPWAARANVLAALSISLKEFHETGAMYSLALYAALDLCWIELAIGRIPHILFCLNVADFIGAHSSLDEDEKKQFLLFRDNFDAVLSVLILKTEFEQLQLLADVYSRFESLGLTCSQAAILFALGDLDSLRKKGWFEADKDDAFIEEFFTRLARQPAYADLPAKPDFLNEDTCIFTSKVLGCDLSVKLENNTNSILIAESLLAALEAFLATSLDQDLMPYQPDLEVVVKTSKNVKSKLGADITVDEYGLVTEVIHKDDFSLPSQEAMYEFRDFIKEFLAIALPSMAIIRDPDSFFNNAEAENIFARSLIFSDMVTVSSNVFGDLDWMQPNSSKDSSTGAQVTVLRKSPWTPTVKTEAAGKIISLKDTKMGEGPVPEELLSTNIKHGDRKVSSLINIALWDKAKWRGLVVGVSPDTHIPPYVGLYFENESPAIGIFKQWIKKLGNEDQDDALRLALILGIDVENPAHYTAHIGTNLKSLSREEHQKQMVFVSRLNRMSPTTSQNLEMFKQAYAKAGSFTLVPAILKPWGMELLPQHAIAKKNIVFKPAWQIGEHDEDFPALGVNDNPIVPDGTQDPPCFEAIKRKREIIKKRR